MPDLGDNFWPVVILFEGLTFESTIILLGQSVATPLCALKPYLGVLSWSWI